MSGQLYFLEVFFTKRPPLGKKCRAVLSTTLKTWRNYLKHYYNWPFDHNISTWNWDTCLQRSLLMARFACQWRFCRQAFQFLWLLCFANFRWRLCHLSRLESGTTVPARPAVWPPSSPSEPAAVNESLGSCGQLYGLVIGLNALKLESLNFDIQYRYFRAVWLLLSFWVLPGSL